MRFSGMFCGRDLLNSQDVRIKMANTLFWLSIGLGSNKSKLKRRTEDQISFKALQMCCTESHCTRHILMTSFGK